VSRPSCTKSTTWSTVRRTPGTAERFLDEYRATVVGREAGFGRPLTAADQLEIVDTLVGEANSYTHLSNLYQSDWHFKVAVNEIYDTLGTLHGNGIFTPKATVSPALAATILYANGFKSDYMKAGRNGGNLDNAADHTA